MPINLFILPYLLFFGTDTGQQEAKFSPISNSRQLVIVLSPHADSVNAKLWRYEKQVKVWKQVGSAHPVTLGHKGIGWGRGLHETQGGYQKKEGDGKSPAGIFRFGTAFGYAPATDVSFKMDYLQLSKEQICVEDADSRYYNQIIDETTVDKDWDSNEAMRREDWLYKWGLMVEHNTPAKPGSGSCIFFHLWRKQGSPTLGCTAMAEDNLLDLIQWLDSTKEPLLVQLVEKDYETFRKKYGLPDLQEK